MNLFGIGNLELLWVLIIALVVLGPGRMVEAARTAGKFWREAQHVLRAAADAATVDLDAPPPARTPPRDPLPEPEDAVARGAGSGSVEGNAEGEPVPGKSEGS